MNIMSAEKDLIYYLTSTLNKIVKYEIKFFKV